MKKSNNEQINLEWLISQNSKSVISVKPSITECATIMQHLKDQIASIEDTIAISGSDANSETHNKLFYLRLRLEYWQKQLNEASWEIDPIVEEANGMATETANLFIEPRNEDSTDDTYLPVQQLPNLRGKHWKPLTDPDRNFQEYNLQKDNAIVKINHHGSFADGSVTCKFECISKLISVNQLEHNTQVSFLLSNGQLIIGKVVLYRGFKGVLFPIHLLPKGFPVPPKTTIQPVKLQKIIVG